MNPERAARAIAFVEALLGPGADVWAQGDGIFEVRANGKHVTFIKVTKKGKIRWL